MDNVAGFRQIKLVPQTLFQLYGDYDAPSDWSKMQWVDAILEKYIVIERHHHWTPHANPDWDIAVIARLFVPLLVEPENTVSASKLLLIQRYPNTAWEHDIIVHVFAIINVQLVNENHINLDKWRSQTTWLSVAAHLYIK